jgi:O-antigen ligase
VDGHRVRSIAEIDNIIQRSPAGQLLGVSIIRNGEHADFPGFVVNDTLKSTPGPSGLQGSGHTHRFRASGWTRHYETFCETLQILAQLALGLAIAGFRGLQRRLSGALALAAALLLTVGVALTAMRSVLVALMIGSLVIAWRTRSWRLRVLSMAVVAAIAGLGLYSVAATRASGALVLSDDSARLRAQVARVGISRIAERLLFGHGMDSIKSHWHEWGFPGNVVIHLHSTPLELAFERGIPALIFWLWIFALFWDTAAKGEQRFRESDYPYRWGVLLGSLGAITGFFASSLVNYNFGDGEVALVFWWLMGITVVLSSDRALDRSANGKEITATDGPYQHHLF